MKATRLTSRYAKSLLSLSIEQNTLDKTFSDMKCIQNIRMDPTEEQQRARRETLKILIDLKTIVHINV